ncbi:CidA/LrgA family protein [Ancylobacter lacus]|uniref:CidA/LrgA family protein n=1 Tax=Ancylobacter lacus TaxID=2579970 RepID=UPI001BCB2499|nr:CidA/LrgA family protein [Ancylobacter lacus]MBS7540565.1 CidA/LrgA family protein [Ancylobacter lacus]
MKPIAFRSAAARPAATRPALPRAARVARLVRHSPLLQVGLVAGFWLAGEAMVRLLGLPLPGGLVGLALVLALLASGRLKRQNLRRGAQWLLADMLLFFVPAVLAVLDHGELIGLTGLKILFVILLSTVMVMVVTALTVEALSRWSRADDEPALS